MSTEADVGTPVSFSEARRFWVRLGFISFGGPAGQIAILHRELVERRKWVTEEQFLHALNFCMLLPGPEAQQLATYVGWLLHGVRGAVLAGTTFVLPSIAILLALSFLYAVWGTVAWVASVLWGFKPAVVAIVAEAVLRIGRRALRRRIHFLIAAAAFLAIHFFGVPFPAIVAGAAAVGFLESRLVQAAAPGPRASPPKGTGKRTLRTLVAGVLLWGAVYGIVLAVRGPESLHAELYRFFSWAAFVTFGGAYAVLAYVSQAAVESHGWISATEAIDGLALAETTPGPLIMVLQFIGFMAAWHHPEGLAPLTSAVAGALLTTWATFLPSIFFILLGAPYVETLRGSPRLQAALGGITAAVVGIVLDLGWVFASAVIRPGEGSEGTDFFAAALAVAAFFVLRRFQVGVHWVVLGSGLVGLSRLFLVSGP